MVKQIDKLLLKSFLGPFLVTFSISIFVLIMQILWVALEKIAGKGIGFFLILELMVYSSASLIQMALPLALLISSVMVLGSMGEHHELSSLKSAGVSLLRVMRPLIICGILAGTISFLCADFVVPAANIQAGSRMYDIQQKKPSLSLEAGSFNEDFDQFAIHIGKKDSDGRKIEDVFISDHSQSNTGQLSELTARAGEMYSSDTGQYFIMQLYDGFQYAERGGKSGEQRNKYPFVRTEFSSYTKIFDLSEFNLEQTDRGLFSQNRSMLTSWQLQQAADSIEANIVFKKQSLNSILPNYLTILPVKNDEKAIPASDLKKPLARVSFPATMDYHDNHLKHIDQLALARQAQVFTRARASVRTMLTQAESTLRTLPNMRETKARHLYDLHMKYSMALVCLLFIFIGAPLGAIVRKGGFGYPILISIMFFVAFIILTIACRKLAESFVLSGVFAGWLPCLVLFPIGFLLTYFSMNDRRLSF